MNFAKHIRTKTKFTTDMRGAKFARIVGVGMTPVGKLGQKPTKLMRSALETALGDAGMTLRQLDGLVAIPSLAEPHFVCSSEYKFHKTTSKSNERMQIAYI